MPGLATTIRIIGAILGIVLIHAAFLLDRPALGFFSIALISVLGLVTGRRAAAAFPGSAILVVICILAVAGAIGFGEPAIQKYFLIAIPIFVHAVLFAVFGSSLLPGRTALITCFSRVERAPVVDPVIESYTRTVTWIWTLYFGVVLAGAIAMVITDNIIVASWITSVLSPSAGVALFLGEHLHRYLRPDVFGPTSMFRTLRAMMHPDVWRLVKHGS